MSKIDTNQPLFSMTFGPQAAPCTITAKKLEGSNLSTFCIYTNGPGPITMTPTEMGVLGEAMTVAAHAVEAELRKGMH